MKKGIQARFVVNGGMSTPEEKCMGVFGMSIDRLVNTILINADRRYDRLYETQKK
jgi:hypothetical protein